MASAAVEHLHERELRNDARRESLALFGLCSPALLLVFVVMVIPVAWLFWLSFVGNDGHLSLANYQRMLASKYYVRVVAQLALVQVLHGSARHYGLG